MEDVDVKQFIGESGRKMRQRLYDVAFYELRSIVLKNMRQMRVREGGFNVE
jgi:transposase